MFNIIDLVYNWFLNWIYLKKAKIESFNYLSQKSISLSDIKYKYLELDYNFKLLRTLKLSNASKILMKHKEISVTRQNVKFLSKFFPQNTCRSSMIHIKDKKSFCNLVSIYITVSNLCWAAAKPGRSERGQNKAATLAAKNLDRLVGRPKHRRTATLAVRQNQRTRKEESNDILITSNEVKKSRIISSIGQKMKKFNEIKSCNRVHSFISEPHTIYRRRLRGDKKNRVTPNLTHVQNTNFAYCGADWNPRNFQ
ncbi:hypothetical protein BpHYR1_002109 [Brachionus plicatilis]|uniref:Uncharacterized protein n=1 Tax=Brachionus plicatilis TaxID=10195 RepID=A0A3M7T8R5_BRAPC|nr:hypothetical protein BpHYR1_002109 [Brachionus plicatilis]